MRLLLSNISAHPHWRACHFHSVTVHIKLYDNFQIHPRHSLTQEVTGLGMKLAVAWHTQVEQGSWRHLQPAIVHMQHMRCSDMQCVQASRVFSLQGIRRKVPHVCNSRLS